MCALLHRSKLNLLAKSRLKKSAIFLNSQVRDFCRLSSEAAEVDNKAFEDDLTRVEDLLRTCFKLLWKAQFGRILD